MEQTSWRGIKSYTQAWRPHLRLVHLIHEPHSRPRALDHSPLPTVKSLESRLRLSCLYSLPMWGQGERGRRGLSKHWDSRSSPCSVQSSQEKCQNLQCRKLEKQQLISGLISLGTTGNEVWWGWEPHRGVVALSFACSQRSQFAMVTPSFPKGQAFQQGAPVSVSDQKTHLEIVRVGAAHHPAPLARPAPCCPEGRAPKVRQGLTDILAPGEGQGRVNCPCLLLRRWWLVAVVPGLLGWQHVHLWVRVLIWVFIIAVLQVQTLCSGQHACLGGRSCSPSRGARKQGWEGLAKQG